MIVDILRLARWEWFKHRRRESHGRRPLLHPIPLRTSSRILSVEFAGTHSDFPIRTKLLGLRSAQDYPQFKDGTVYRQVRPTNVVVSEVRTVLSGIPMPTANDWY